MGPLCGSFRFSAAPSPWLAFKEYLVYLMIKRVAEGELPIILVAFMPWACFPVYSAVNYAVISQVIPSLPFTSGFWGEPKSAQDLLESEAHSSHSNQQLQIAGGLLCSFHYLCLCPCSNKGLGSCSCALCSLHISYYYKIARIISRSPDLGPQF